ncbi:hypothetical protein [Streptomyces sp. NPDC051452]|uniref:hypothetical protein n=1 Tax=Streptomyces sp. NPDC051452 TaxID=3365654 RepID=UPI0037A45F53
MAEARLTLLDPAGKVVASAVAIADGTYTLRDLHTAGPAPGDYTVVASGYPPVATEAALSDGEARRGDIDVRGGATG